MIHIWEDNFTGWKRIGKEEGETGKWKGGR